MLLRALFIFALLSAIPLHAGDARGSLHIASPDWRDQIVYFLMIDRFDDGDPGNNDQGVGEYDPADGRRYSGGDLAGIRRRLDYIQGLGATAIWITPPVAHQWWDGSVDYGGYHGYWGEHFMEVDPHFGTLAEYQGLSRELHARGMYLIQDVVLNHVGNYFSYPDGWDEGDPTMHLRMNPDARPSPAPRQSPFDRNDVRDPEHRAAEIYHWTPVIADFTDRRQELDFQLADLDDLNTESPVVRQVLRRSYGHWIEHVGVDAFRVDTAFHVPPALFADFLHGDDPDVPGIAEIARATGRDDFLVFGEGFGVDRPYEDTLAHKIESYKTGTDGEALLPGMLNFPLYGSVADVFARGRPTAVLAHRIDSMMRVHARPQRMPSFIDNHDVDRFLAVGDEAGLKQALLLIMTLPGIPVLYYGTEQGFTQPRRAMFAGGHQAGDGGHFDTEAPLYRYIASVTALRRQHPLLARGTPVPLRSQASGPGALAYRIDGDDGDVALVVFNSAPHEVLLDALDTGRPGVRWRLLYSIDGGGDELATDRTGRVHLVLPPYSGLVWKAAADLAVTPRSRARLRLNSGLPERVSGDFEISGRARSAGPIVLVVDGDLQRAQPVELDDHGRWRASVDTSAMASAQVEHRVLAWAPEAGLASTAHRFRVERTWHHAVRAIDPAGDDAGPAGRYRYPSDPSWGEHRQLDLLGAEIETAGGALRLTLRMRAVTASWNPPAGFDHVAFTIYLSLPDRDGGTRILPLQNAQMPDGLRWHYRLRAGGWSQVLTSTDGAGADHEGRPVLPGAEVEVDRDAGTIRFTLPAAALGRPETLARISHTPPAAGADPSAGTPTPPSGSRAASQRRLDALATDECEKCGLAGATVYITTWDYDGGYRGLDSEPGSHRFGGGNGRRDPLIMDDLLIRLPARGGKRSGDEGG